MNRTLLLFMLGNALAAAAVAASGAERPVVSMAFSSVHFGNVNRNDVDAALQVYARAVAEQGGFELAGGPQVLTGTGEIEGALRRKSVDVIALTAAEYLAMEEHGLMVGPLLAAAVNQGYTEEYVLLARRDGDIRKVADLPGRSVVVSTELRASLARIWLDVICLEQGLGTAAATLRKLSLAEKLTLVVLPVFFRQADACVVTRSGLDVMGELNPQVKNQLCVVAVSRPLLPTFTAFRGDFSARYRQRIIESTVDASHRPAFAQLKALFKADRLGLQPLSALDSARALLATHRRLCAPNQGATAVPAERGSGAAGGTR